MTFSYEHSDGSVKAFVTSCREKLEAKPFCVRVLKELDRTPNTDETVDANGDIVKRPKPENPDKAKLVRLKAKRDKGDALSDEEKDELLDILLRMAT